MPADAPVIRAVLRCTGARVLGFWFTRSPVHGFRVHRFSYDPGVRPLKVLGLAGAAGLVSLSLGAQAPRPSSPAAFTVVEAGIADMQAAMARGRTTSREIVQQYLTRIALYEDRLNAAMAINPRALEEEI